MVRIILLLFFICLVAAAGLTIRSCQQRPSAEAQAPPAGADDGIVALPDGATLLVQKGTIGRELIDWLETAETSRAFELGGTEFVGRSPEPTPEAAGRLPRLIALLKAHRKVDIKIVGHSDASADRAADQALSEERASTVAKALQAGGVSGDRISVEGRGGEQPIADNASPQGRARNQRVSIVLTRGP